MYYCYISLSVNSKQFINISSAVWIFEVWKNLNKSLEVTDSTVERRFSTRYVPQKVVLNRICVNWITILQYVPEKHGKCKMNIYLRVYIKYVGSESL